MSLVLCLAQIAVHSEYTRLTNVCPARLAVTGAQRPSSPPPHPCSDTPHSHWDRFLPYPLLPCIWPRFRPGAQFEVSEVKFPPPLS